MNDELEDRRMATDPVYRNQVFKERWSQAEGALQHIQAIVEWANKRSPRRALETRARERSTEKASRKTSPGEGRQGPPPAPSPSPAEP